MRLPPVVFTYVEAASEECWLVTPAAARRFFDEISQDTGKYVFGVADTLQCLEMGAVETLIVWENLEVRPVPASLWRPELLSPSTLD